MALGYEEKVNMWYWPCAGGKKKTKKFHSFSVETHELWLCKTQPLLENSPWGEEGALGVEHSPSILETLGSIPSTTKIKKQNQSLKH
jgi:hypothetical protein